MIQFQRSGGRLPLTGPYRAISADGCVSIVLDLHHSREDNASAISSSSSTSYVSEILLDVYDENTKYDEAITYDDGQAAVTYALLSNAAEAVVEVRLLRERPTSSTAVVRKVVARTRLGEVVLFDDDEGVNVSTGTEEQPAGVVVVPLARSVVAVPKASSLTLVVDLVVGDHDGEEEVVKDSVLCEPKVRGEEVYRGSIVEVKVTWLD